MLIICQNGSPLFVCPEVTTSKEAQVFAEAYQAEHYSKNTELIHIHVQNVKLLDYTTIKEARS